MSFELEFQIWFRATIKLVACKSRQYKFRIQNLESWARECQRPKMRPAADVELKVRALPGRDGGRDGCQDGGSCVGKPAATRAAASDDGPAAVTQGS